jgi:hypothetical protein
MFFLDDAVENYTGMTINWGLVKRFSVPIMG